MEHKRSLFRDIFGVFSTNIYTLLLGALIGIILPRTLGPEKMGIYIAIMVVPSLLFRLFELGIKSSTIFHTGKKIFTEQEILSAVMIIYFISIATCTLILLSTYYAISDPAYTFNLILIVLFVTPLQLLIAYSKGILIARQRIRAFNRVNGLVATLNILCVILFVVILKWSVAGALLAILVANLTLGIISLQLIFRGFSFKIKVNGKVIRSLYRYGIMIAMSFFIMRLNYQADILILQKLSTHEVIGFYSLGVNIAQLLWEIPAAVGLVIITRSAHAEDESVMTGEVNRVLRLSVIFTFAAAIAIYFLTPPMLPLIWGQKFIPSIEMTRVILPGVFTVTIFQVINSYFVGTGKPLYAVLVFVPALLINIGLNFLWIPLYSGTGAAMATNVSYFIGTVTMLIIYSKISRTSLIKIFSYSRSDFRFIKKLWRQVFKRNGN